VRSFLVRCSGRWFFFVHLGEPRLLLFHDAIDKEPHSGKLTLKEGRQYNAQRQNMGIFDDLTLMMQRYLRSNLPGCICHVNWKATDVITADVKMCIIVNPDARQNSSFGTPFFFLPIIPHAYFCFHILNTVEFHPVKE